MSIDIKILQSTCCGPAGDITENVKAAVVKSGIEAQIEQPSDLQEIMKYGTMTFPSLVINGRVYDFEDFSSADELAEFLTRQEVAKT